MKIIKKYPYVKQRRPNQCGPACVQMILKYYHGYVNLDKLSEMMETNQNGTTAYNLNETLKLLGFKSYGIKTEDLSSLKLPCIAHTKISRSYGHYIVIYKVNVKRKKLLIADPATGLKKISFRDFQKIWSGVTIQMRPHTKIVSEGEPNTKKFIYNLIFKKPKRLKTILLYTFFTLIFYILYSLYLPIIILASNFAFYAFISLAVAILFLTNLLSLLKNKINISLNLKLERELSLDIFKNILNLPYRYYRQKTTGEIISYFSDIQIVCQAINRFINVIFIDIPFTFIISILIGLINFKILLLEIGLLGFLSLITYSFHEKQKVWISETVRLKAEKTSIIAENILGFETLKNLNIVKKIYWKFKQKDKEFLKANNKVLSVEEKSEFCKGLIRISNIILIITLLGYTNIKEFITLYVLTETFLQAFQNILSTNYQFNEVNAALTNLTELCERQNEKKRLVKKCGDIVIKNLNYSFDKTPILQNINLTIPFGTKALITGDSGSGKSTLFKIIKGYYDNYQGHVKISGKEVNKHFFPNIVYVSQKEILFTGTLESNLNLKSKNKRNLKICEINEFAKNNYYQFIEEDGFNLSGGQKQRIILARALNNFQIIIIDEGLNQISTDMERRILKKILQTYPQKTIIYISHRLDNLDLFDKYIKLNKGKVVINSERNN